VVDTSGISSLAMTEIAAARDALLSVGSSASGGLLLASSTNQFTGVLSGATLEVKQTSSSPVTITIGPSDTDLVASVKATVDNYNTFREKLGDDTAYDAATNQGAVLFGDSAALRLDTDLSNLLSGRFLGAGSIQSLGELGISINDDGTLTFDQAVLQAKFAADPQGVQDFFAAEDVGFSAKLTQLIEQLCGEENSLLAQRLKSLDAKISENQATIETMNTRLDKQRERLVMEFARVEAAVAKMQANLSILDSISYLWSNSSKSNSSSSSSS